MVRTSHRPKTRPESQSAAEIVDAPSLPPIRPPRWVPAGIEFDHLPRPVQQALVEIVEPLYEQLVMAAEDGLERSTGLTLVHLLWLEILDQRDIGLEYGATAVLNLPLPGRHTAIARHLRLIEGKVRTGQFLLQVRNWVRRAAREADSWPPLAVTSRPAPSLPDEGRILENMKSVAQNGAAIEQHKDQSPAMPVLENVTSGVQKASAEPGHEDA
jgi:hypothetical protein